MLVIEGEELEEVDESASGRSMASAMEQSRCVWFLKFLMPELSICRETNFGSTVLKY